MSPIVWKFMAAFSPQEIRHKSVRRRSHLLIGCSLACWACATCWGVSLLWEYEGAPGGQGKAPPRWPIQKTPIDQTHYRLVVFVHPHCSCSRATLGELARLMAQSEDRIAAEVLFVRPPNMPPEWVYTDLWRSAAAIPGVQVKEDTDGVQAALFGAETSGDALLYSPSGVLLFSGGITASRAHEGDNAGENTILSLVEGAHMSREVQTPVYGCALAAKSKMHIAKGASQCLK